MGNNGSPAEGRLGEFAAGIKRAPVAANEADKLFGLLRAALSENAQGVTFEPLLPLVAEVRRQNPARDADVRFRCPDEMVVNIRGDVARRDIYMLVRIDRQLADRVTSPVIRPETSLILPGG